MSDPNDEIQDHPDVVKRLKVAIHLGTAPSRQDIIAAIDEIEGLRNAVLIADRGLASAPVAYLDREDSQTIIEQVTRLNDLGVTIKYKGMRNE